MAFKLQVILAGLITLVEEKNANGTVKALHALLVDARTKGDDGKHPHEPFMAFNAEDYGDHSGYKVTGGPDSRGDYACKCVLNKESLSVQTSNGSLSNLRLPRRTMNPYPTKPGEEDSLAWVPKLSLLNHSGLDFSQLHPGCIPNLHNVAAKITFTTGRIRTLSLGRHRESRAPRYITWNFKVDAGSPILLSKALADKVGIELHIPHDHVVIASSLSNTSLSLKPPKHRKIITLTIGNFPTNPHLAPTTEVNHFQWYYELLENPPQIDKRPIPFAPPFRQASPTGGFCPLVGGG